MLPMAISTIIQFCLLLTILVTRVQQNITEYRIHLRIEYQDLDTMPYAINFAIFDAIRYIMPSLLQSIPGSPTLAVYLLCM